MLGEWIENFSESPLSIPNKGTFMLNDCLRQSVGTRTGINARNDIIECVPHDCQKIKEGLSSHHKLLLLLDCGHGTKRWTNEFVSLKDVSA